MMDCKKDLTETGGDMEAAVKFLREKGLSSAAKRAHKAANEGQIFSYIHNNNKLGVIVELNCETDFVAKTDDFQALGRNLAMQVAAAAPLVVRREDIPEEVLKKEMEILDSLVIRVARAAAVPAGGALAVDRDAFSSEVEAQLGELEARIGAPVAERPEWPV